MGAEAARPAGPITGPSGAGGGHEGSRTYQGPVNFPNICPREGEASAWTLLHQCGLDRWKDGHAGKLENVQYVYWFANTGRKRCTQNSCR